MIHTKKGLNKSRHRTKVNATQGFTEKYNERKKEKIKYKFHLQLA